MLIGGAWPLLKGVGREGREVEEEGKEGMG